MSRNLIITATIALGTLASIIVWLSRPFLLRHQLSQRYAQAQRGMTAEQIETLMSNHGRWLPAPPQFAAWDDKALPPAEAQRIKSVLRYPIRTFYLPAFFEFTFDDQRRLIGKHLYD